MAEKKAPSYEEKMRRLDEILTRLDESETPIDELARDVKEGAQLIRELGQKLNRDATLEEIAADSGFTVERVGELLELVQEHVSLETPIGDGESTMSDLIEDHGAAAPEAEAATTSRPRASGSPPRAPRSRRPRAAPAAPRSATSPIS